MVHINANILLIVKAVQQETPGYLSVRFERPWNFNFQAGDWVDLSFPGVTLEGGVTYSLASSPSEPDLQITFREGVSPFKKALMSLVPGDKVSIDQYGNDFGFRLRETQPSTLIAGGVGIAPFRSMLKEMAETGSKNQVHVIFFNSSDSFLFKDELNECAASLANVRISYFATRELKRKDREKLLSHEISADEQQYYVAGPSSMVSSTITLLKSLGVPERAIKLDDFGLY